MNHIRDRREELVSSIATIYYLKCLVFSIKLQDKQTNRNM